MSPSSYCVLSSLHNFAVSAFQLANVQASEEMQGIIIPDLEKMRSEMKTKLLAVKNALLDALPANAVKNKSDSLIPFYYDEGSWNQMSAVPWHKPEKRCMTPAEGVTFLASHRDELEIKLKALQREFKSANQSAAIAAQGRSQAQPGPGGEEAARDDASTGHTPAG